MIAPDAFSTVGPAGRVPPQQLVRAAGLVRAGRSFSLAAPRFPGMPLFPGHPPFQVLTYRTPHGLRVGRENLWAPTPNDAHLGCMTEVVSSTTHSGAHIDALAHITVGHDAHWFGGANAADHLGDFGPTVGDAESLPALFTRGVLVDAARHRRVACLPAGSPVSAEEILSILAEQDIDSVRMAEHKTPGPDLSAANLFAERGVIAVGSDTETFEVQPTPDAGQPSNPQPVHTRLLIDEGIYIMESLDLEQIAAARISEFLFVALPLKIRGATGSMIDPLAVILRLNARYERGHA